MCGNGKHSSGGGRRIWKAIRDELSAQGIDIDSLFEQISDEAGARMVCIASDLQDSVREMAGATRDQVVMVRLDEDSLKSLDAWVASGAVKSRSEAAALFIREGLNLREHELDQLRDALRDVEAAKERLKKRATEVFGTDKDDEDQ